MITRFWGVRGSLPTPGPETARIGGNTACVSVESRDQVLVLDAGTGIRNLGKTLVGTASEITLLTTHLHLDHVIGIPFFAPLYEGGRTVNLVPVATDRGPRSPLEVIDGVYFPRHRRELPASCQVVRDPVEFLAERGFEFTCLDLEHPGGCSGFRIGCDGGTLVYMTDNELGSYTRETEAWQELIDFTQDADLLCHDAQYLIGEIETKRGWGHSTAEEVCELAIEGQVRHAVLFHHDPARTDAEVGEIETRARKILTPEGIRCTAASEGLSLEVP